MAISYGRTDIETPIHADIKETISHGIIVSNLAYLVGKELGLQEEVCYDLAVAGMLHDLGKVRLNFYMNEKVEDEILAVDINRHRQKIGMVFQQFNLFPHKTVKQNIMMAPVIHIIW